MNFSIYSPQGITSSIEGESAITIGVFDGVHRGHFDLVRQLAACDPRLKPVVVTLSSHPAFVLGRRQNELWLDEPKEHRHLLFQAGAAYVVELPFTPEVARLSACQMAKALYEGLHMRHLLVGYDSRFGSRSNDDYDHLPQYGQELGFSFCNGKRYLYKEMAVSSSAIRHSLQNGDVDMAGDMLGRCYSLRGEVKHGRGVGRTIGFPTANVDLSECRKMLPKEGVYAVRLDGLPAIANLGTAPTYGIEKPLLEVHLTNFDGNLYDKKVEVTFIHRLRDTARFESVEELKHQLQCDMIDSKQWL